MPVEQSEDRQTERPVCLANAHDSLIRIIENPKNHVDGWTPIDRIQTRLPREHGYTVKEARHGLEAIPLMTREEWERKGVAEGE